MKRPDILMIEARDEAYEYFDKQISSLPKKPDGTIDLDADGFHNNDVDAFRHAYVSGVFTFEYNETAADIFGRLNEYFFADAYSNSRDPRNLNMDLWNNAVGRKLAKKIKNREELLKAVHGALKNGDLIIRLDDDREYKGAKSNPQNASKPVIVVAESETGRNELFWDMEKKEFLSLAVFVSKIEAGEYPGYAVKLIKGVSTPVSNPDSRETNNLS